MHNPVNCDYDTKILQLIKLTEVHANAPNDGRAVRNFTKIIGNFYCSIIPQLTMNILGLLLFVLLAIASSIVEAGKRCTSSEQCDYESACYEGHCYTVDEMFEKFDMKKK
ncbi:hypothetical protein B9Z55_016347 [Caenorhabditis nigoni]|uniref:Uncharacterized protein n=1 Tax=Caenorhabditis nigoni TaxID=1611254 RepID=A0A2G5T4R2_9PELO|nr:hypothetical protein B9Z55_016347 [Caenorhabditis nigoni]